MPARIGRVALHLARFDRHEVLLDHRSDNGRLGWRDGGESASAIVERIEKHPAFSTDPIEVRVPPAAPEIPGRDELRAAPLSSVWITVEMLRRTRNVWSKAYGRPIDDGEAMEILSNVKRFAEVLLNAGSAESQP